MPGAHTPFAVCFTGHRPEKLPDGTERLLLKSLLYEEILAALKDGADTFYTGMAQGVDIWAAEMVLRFRSLRGPRLIAVRPFEAHGKTLHGEELYRYENVMQAADEIITLSPQYHRDCYRQRNAYMIAHSQRLIAVVTDMRSGTGQTIRMAEKQGLDIRRLRMEPAPFRQEEGGNPPSA